MRPPALDLAKFGDVPFPVATRAELRRAGMMRVEAMGRTLLAVWNGGAPRVYADACPHLGYPLSRGTLRGDRIVCPYHGWAFAQDDGAVVEQPTLPRPRPCRAERFGALVAGDLVFAWMGDPADEQRTRAMLPEQVLEGFELYRIVFDCPFYLALFNSVDYAHFGYHELYKPIYAIYRRFRGNSHLPGSPFSSRIAEENDRFVQVRIEEAGRDIRMYATASEFVDDGGVNHFQTFVTPLGPTRTQYWECFRPRSPNPLTRLAARIAFHTVIVRLLEGEDHEWTGASTPAFLEGRNVNLGENDLPLGAHLKKFVVPRMKATGGDPGEGLGEGPGADAPGLPARALEAG